MEQKEIQNRKTEIITDIFCDCCGKSCKVDEATVENPLRLDDGEKYYSFEFMKLEANWGYFSKKDLENWSAQICEQCVDEKFSFIKFKNREIKFHTSLR